MNRYEILIDATDTVALDVTRELFTNVATATSPESAAVVVVTFDATDDALNAYAARFDFDPDELDDIVVAID